MPFLNPNDAAFAAGSDSQTLQNAIDEAGRGSVRTVVIPRHCSRTGKDEWVIERTLLLPDDVTIVLDDCRLRLADGVYENIFRNKNMYTDEGLTQAGEQHGIRIVGFGNAILDGGKDNGVREQNWQREHLPHPRTGNLILLNNVRDYSLENFKCVNMRYWAINQIACRRGRVRKIVFDNGIHHPNQDGINFRIGCCEMQVEDISGRTGDDVVALSAFPKGGDAALLPEGRKPDIHDIVIRNVQAHTFQSVVAMRNTDGAKMYNITVENIADVGGDMGAWGIVRIGENNYYHERPALPGETYGITVRNIRSQCKGTVYISAALKDSTISDVYAGGTSLYAVSTFQPDIIFWENGCRLSGGAAMENVLMQNIHYYGTSEYDDSDLEKYEWIALPGAHFPGCALDFRRMRDTDFLKNVTARDIFTREGTQKLLIRDGFSLNMQ